MFIVLLLSVVEEVWKQQTLLQLLQVVEVPVLDCILTSPERVHLRACRNSVAAQDLVISNTCLERELSDVLNLNKWALIWCASSATSENSLEKIQLFFACIYRLDGWLSAAADCLELFPDQLIVFAGEQLSQNGGDTLSEEWTATQKRLLFDTIAKFYSGKDKPPLLPGQHLDIHAAILNLLGKYR